MSGARPTLAAVDGEPTGAWATDITRPPLDDAGSGDGKKGAGGGAGASSLGDDCPVRALGHRDGTFFYLSPSGQLRALGEREHSALGLTGLFEGHLAWLFETFPRFNKPKDGEASQVIGWMDRRAAAALMHACAEAGLFNPDTQLRGPGAWALSDGGLVLHCGDQLARYDAERPEGEYMAAGVRLDGAVYAAWAPEAKPAARAASAADGQDMLRLFSRWKWRAPHEAPRLLVGWHGQAYLCGAFNWRAHIWVTGDKGVGKTTAQDATFGLLGDALWKVSDPTPAGLRQALNGSARPVAIDEIEASETNSRSRDVVELMRLASSDRQGRVLRGSAEGRASAYSIKAAFYCTSVLHPPFKPQDVSRITVLELDALDLDAAASTAVRREIKRVVALGPSFRARMAHAFAEGRLQRNLAIYERALGELRFSARLADQYGVLLACAESLLSDGAAEADAVIDFLKEFPLDEFIERGEDDDHDLCRNHLFSAPVDVWDNGRRATVGQVIAGALGGSGGEAALKTLQACGLRLESFGGATWLVVARQHQGLERIFAGSRWAGGVWAQALPRVPGAIKGKVMVFAGARARTVWVPPQGYRAGDDDPPAPPVASG